MSKKYDEASVIRALTAKKCQINSVNKIVSVPRGVLGNGSWGKVDYLCHYCGYTQTFIDNSSVPVKEEDDTKLYNKPKRKKDIGTMNSINLKRVSL